MSLGYCDTSKITAIADSIRSKTGKTETMNLDSMPTEIESISVGVDSGIFITPLEGADSNYTDYEQLTNDLITEINTTNLSTAVNNNSEVTTTDTETILSADLSSIMKESLYFSIYSNAMFGAKTVSESVSSGHLYRTTYFYGVTAEVLEFKNTIINFNKLFYLPKYSSSTGSATGTLNGTSYSGTAYFKKYYYRGTINKLIFNNCSCYSTTLDNFISSESGSTTSSFYIKEIDFGNLDTSAITSMKDAFNTSALTTLTLSENWGSNSSLNSMSLSLCSNLTHDSCLDIFNKLATRTSSATLTLNSTTKALMSADEIKIATDKGWTVS